MVIIGYKFKETYTSTKVIVDKHSVKRDTKTFTEGFFRGAPMYLCRPLFWVPDSDLKKDKRFQYYQQTDVYNPYDDDGEEKFGYAAFQKHEPHKWRDVYLFGDEFRLVDFRKKPMTYDQFLKQFGEKPKSLFDVSE